MAGWRPETQLNQMILLVFFIISRHEQHKKESICEKACLQRCCIATEVMWLLLAYSLPLEYVYRVVA
jgi:hypothetical protein